MRYENPEYPTISEYLTMITNYRNNLLITYKKEKLAKMSWIVEQKFLNEIILCNQYIEYLHAWDKFYHGPTIPYNNDELIKKVESYLGIDHDPYDRANMDVVYPMYKQAPYTTVRKPGGSTEYLTEHNKDTKPVILNTLSPGERKKYKNK